MVRQVSGREGIHLQLSSHEIRQRRPADALGLDHPALRRLRTAQAQRHKGPSHPEAGSAPAPGPPSLHQCRRRGAGSVLRHRHVGRGGQEARPRFHRHRTRSRLRGPGRTAHCRHCPGRRRGTGCHHQEARAPHPFRLGHGTGPARSRPGADGQPPPLRRQGAGRWQPSGRRRDRVDPQGGRPCPGLERV